jgi:hypothetical protein
MDSTIDKSIGSMGAGAWGNITSKHGTPCHVFSKMKLTSLAGCPDTVSNSLSVDDNCLHGSPKIVMGDFDASDNVDLTSLVGGPREVSKTYSVVNCAVSSLDGIPVTIGANLILSDNPLTSLQGIHKLKEMNGSIYLIECPITSHILGVFFIKGCAHIFSNGTRDGEVAMQILNKHIKQGRAGLLPCQQELIEAGLADFAQI